MLKDVREDMQRIRVDLPSCILKFMPIPALGEWTCNASPTRNTRECFEDELETRRLVPNTPHQSIWVISISYGESISLSDLRMASGVASDLLGTGAAMRSNPSSLGTKPAPRPSLTIIDWIRISASQYVSVVQGCSLVGEMSLTKVRRRNAI